MTATVAEYAGRVASGSHRRRDHGRHAVPARTDECGAGETAGAVAAVEHQLRGCVPGEQVASAVTVGVGRARECGHLVPALPDRSRPGEAAPAVAAVHPQLAGSRDARDQVRAPVTVEVACGEQRVAPTPARPICPPVPKAPCPVPGYSQSVLLDACTPSRSAVPSPFQSPGATTSRIDPHPEPDPPCRAEATRSVAGPEPQGAGAGRSGHEVGPTAAVELAYGMHVVESAPARTDLAGPAQGPATGAGVEPERSDDETATTSATWSPFRSCWAAGGRVAARALVAVGALTDTQPTTTSARTSAALTRRRVGIPTIMLRLATIRREPEPATSAHARSSSRTSSVTPASSPAAIAV